uniref:Uncharacterized protein n=1 Tax=Aureoumbra lagunensis TaxID=44058 RepID=A0A7U0KSE6_9STRA|nr:hypothetical protein K4Z71_mgp24 [Aureoumbra lagunensis]QQW50402.1 hypothetical protein [Aureoumbra lagunensis]
MKKFRKLNNFLSCIFKKHGKKEKKFIVPYTKPTLQILLFLKIRGEIRYFVVKNNNVCVFFNPFSKKLNLYLRILKKPSINFLRLISNKNFVNFNYLHFY